MKVLAKHMLTTGILLGLFAIIGTGLVAITHEGTEDRIEAAERQAMLRSLHAIITPEQMDNDIYHDVIEATDKALLGSHHPSKIYRARKNGQPVAALLTPIAPNGYGGDIKLLVGVNYDGTIAGVRVITHRETPGLGDDIEIERSSWITSFNNHSLSDLTTNQWKVKKDNGVFDQFTGATITPRAVVGAVHNALRYYQQHRDEIYTSPSLPYEVENHE